MEISITKTTTPKQKPADESKLGFGQYYTDHMFIMNYDEGEGWHNPRIVPYGPFELDPAAIHTPGIFVNRVIQGQFEKRIEQRTLRQKGA